MKKIIKNEVDLLKKKLKEANEIIDRFKIETIKTEKRLSELENENRCYKKLLDGYRNIIFDKNLDLQDK